MSTLPGVPTLASAIAQAEGFNVAGSLPQIDNNPGSITSGGSLVQYPDVATGQEALYNQLQSIMSGGSKYYTPDTTLSQFAQTYSGGDPNYASNLSSILGVPTNTTIGSILSGNTGTDSTASTGTGSGTGLSGILSGITSLPTTVGNAINNTLFSSRVILLVIGVLLIAAGLFSFKTTQTVVTTVGKTAKKVGIL
jgi:hypothetical protein